MSFIFRVSLELYQFPATSNMLQRETETETETGGCENCFPITRNILRVGHKLCIILYNILRYGAQLLESGAL